MVGVNRYIDDAESLPDKEVAESELATAESSGIRVAPLKPLRLEYASAAGIDR